jgi:hypothetical protein
MFEQYVKLFDLNWIEPWIVEALIAMTSGLLLMFIICKAMDCMNKED